MKKLRDIVAEKINWQLPPEPGTVPIPPDHVRLFHQTGESAARRIKHRGIQLANARGIEGPKAIYADERGFYFKPGNERQAQATVEFHVHKDRWNPPFVRADSEWDKGMVDPKDIIAVHYNWHSHARYAEKDPRVRENILNGQHDALLTDKEYGKSIRFIKHKYGKR